MKEWGEEGSSIVGEEAGGGGAGGFVYLKAWSLKFVEICAGIGRDTIFYLFQDSDGSFVPQLVVFKY